MYYIVFAYVVTGVVVAMHVLDLTDSPAALHVLPATAPYTPIDLQNSPESAKEVSSDDSDFVPERRIEMSPFSFGSRVFPDFLPTEREKQILNERRILKERIRKAEARVNRKKTEAHKQQQKEARKQQQQQQKEARKQQKKAYKHHIASKQEEEKRQKVADMDAAEYHRALTATSNRPAGPFVRDMKKHCKCNAEDRSPMLGTMTLAFDNNELMQCGRKIGDPECCNWAVVMVKDTNHVKTFYDECVSPTSDSSHSANDSPKRRQHYRLFEKEALQKGYFKVQPFKCTKKERADFLANKKISDLEVQEAEDFYDACTEADKIVKTREEQARIYGKKSNK